MTETSNAHPHARRQALRAPSAASASYGAAALASPRCSSSSSSPTSSSRACPPSPSTAAVRRGDGRSREGRCRKAAGRRFRRPRQGCLPRAVSGGDGARPTARSSMAFSPGAPMPPRMVVADPPDRQDVEFRRCCPTMPTSISRAQTGQAHRQARCRSPRPMTYVITGDEGSTWQIIVPMAERCDHRLEGRQGRSLVRPDADTAAWQ